MSRKKSKGPTLLELSVRPEPVRNAGPKHPLCLLCKLHEGCETPFMLPFVPKGWKDGKRIACIGEAPGADEDENSGRPFTGKAGRLLRSYFVRVGLTPRDIALFNADRCRPRGNRRPRMREVRACRPFLLYGLSKLRPRLILGLGETALRALINSGGRPSVTAYRGRRLSVPGLAGLDAPVFITYHPAAVLHGGVDLEAKILEDLQRANWPELKFPVWKMPRGKAVGFDTEYAPDGKLLTAAVASRAHAWAAEIR